MSEQKSNSVSVGCGGFSLGAILAVVCSWMVNHSIGWAILHFFCGWFYVAWYLLAHVWHVL